MTPERLDFDGDAAATAAALRRLAPAGASVSGTVSEIVASVRVRGEAALVEYVERFDKTGGGDLLVTREECEAALAALDADVRAGLEVAIRNVRAVAEAGLTEDREVQLPEGHVVRITEQAVRRAAIYVPGGRNPYPSTVVMGVVTAKAAGVDQVAVCAPGAHPVILAACALCEADEVWRMGGAHAIAALAYGTETVPRVDVIAGPGSLYVQEAKRQVFGAVGIDGFNGPSDLTVIASRGADTEALTLDLEAQAEHGEGSLTVAVSDDPGILDALPGLTIHAEDLNTALAFAEALAPEHLQLAGERAEQLAPQVRSAGCLFVGNAAGTAFGDYVAGSNHTLPTEGAARFASGLNVRHFRRRMAEVRLNDAAPALARAGVPIANAEGFAKHAASMALRQNPRP